MCVYFREELAAGFESIEWDFEDGILFKLKKEFFGWEKDFYFMCVYMRSTQTKREDLNDGLNCYDRVLEKIAQIPEDAMFAAMGDWNARWGECIECSVVSDDERRVQCNEIEGMLVENDNLFLKRILF